MSQVRNLSRLLFQTQSIKLHTHPAIYALAQVLTRLGPKRQAAVHALFIAMVWFALPFHLDSTMGLT